jgi:hypothetical protein
MASKIPQSWEPIEVDGAPADFDMAAEADKFRDYWIGEGKTKSDWTATWRNWVRRSWSEGRYARLAGVKTAAPKHGDEFQRQVSILCANFNVPATPERVEGLRETFGKLNPIMFERMVQAITGPDSKVEKFPTAKQLWTVWREMKSNTRPAGVAGDNTDTMKKLVEHAISLSLTDKQRAAVWSWIATKEQIIVGLIIPECDGTAHRIMAASLHKAHVDFL